MFNMIIIQVLEIIILSLKTKHDDLWYSVYASITYIQIWREGIIENISFHLKELIG